MDEMTLLAQLRADVGEPSPAALAAARTRLVEHDVKPAVLTMRPRRPLQRRAVVSLAAAAAVAAGAFALTGNTASPNSPGTAIGSAPGAVSSAPAFVPASQLLDLAAKRTLVTGDPAPKAGQYTYVRTHAWFAASALGADPGAAPPAPASGTPGPVQVSPQVSYLQEDRYEVWTPAGGKGTWYWRYTRPLDTKFFSAADKTYVEENDPSLLRRHVERYTGKDGQMNEPVPVTWGVPTPAWLAALPRDPDALLARLYDDPNKPDNNPAHRYDNAFLHMAQVLSSGLVPADLRAALYTVAATRIPGITVVDSAANLDGQRGVAVGRVQSGPAQSGSRVRQDIIFDSARGQYIGERQVTIGKDTQFDVPSGTAIESTAVRVGVAGKPGFH